MPHHHRGIAFSNKQKKEQLKAKREAKRLLLSECSSSKQNFSLSFNKRERFQDSPNSSTFNLNDTDNIQSKNKRYNLKFHKDSNPKDRKYQYDPINTLSPNQLEEDIGSFFPPGLDYPQRPLWKKNMSKSDLDRNENKSFRQFCEEIDKKYNSEDLSLYELNLETWRQLWRVTEMSDILLIIVDARFAVAQFPPHLYHQLLEKERKGIVLILNKCDLIAPALVLAWQDYFVKRFPRLHILPFCSIENNSIKKRTNLKMAYESARRLVDICQDIAGDEVNLQCWRQKIIDERNVYQKDRCEDLIEIHTQSDTTYHPECFDQRFKDGIVTIGTVGHPNVGKSSLINALMGKKVVSVSKTPGHTKYFQTIFLTKNVKLCDCPGLVFPSLCPKQLQVVLGSFPIAQVRDSLRIVRYIAERIDLVSLLRLEPPYQDSSDSAKQFVWSSFDVCESWALRRRYFTRTKGGRADVSRAANEILRFTLVGFKSLILSLKPPNFFKNEATYSCDPRQDEIKLIQGIHADQYPTIAQASCSADSDSFDQTESESENESTISGESDEDFGKLVSKPNKFEILGDDDDDDET